MKNYFILIFAAALTVTLANAQISYAQDTIKKTVVHKPAVTKTSTTVIMPAGAKPAPAKPGAIPINPKTGKSYSKWGYGTYAKKPYDVAGLHKADSIRKASAAKMVVAPPVAAVVPPRVDTPKAAPATADNSLNGQYHYLLTKVYNYQQPFVAALWKNVIDTLNTNKHKLLDAQAKVADQSKTIATMQTDAATKDALTAKADEINLLGMSLPKGTYNGIMWGLVIILAIVAIAVIARSGKLKYEANYRTGLYNDLDEEFKTYKTKANEKEKKLARELQTERNKLDELMGR